MSSLKLKKVYDPHIFFTLRSMWEACTRLPHESRINVRKLIGLKRDCVDAVIEH